jgi:uncharacterized membrane protein
MDDPDYEALCDIAAKFSCTEVFRSKYAHPLSHWGLVPKGSDLDLGLASAGIILYSAYFLAACLWEVMPFRKPLFLTVASCSACFSVYLLYVLKFILGDFCTPTCGRTDAAITSTRILRLLRRVCRGVWTRWIQRHRVHRLPLRQFRTQHGLQRGSSARR